MIVSNVQNSFFLIDDTLSYLGKPSLKCRQEMLAVPQTDSLKKLHERNKKERKEVEIISIYYKKKELHLPYFIYYFQPYFRTKTFSLERKEN